MAELTSSGKETLQTETSPNKITRKKLLNLLKAIAATAGTISLAKILAACNEVPAETPDQPAVQDQKEEDSMKEDPVQLSFATARLGNNLREEPSTEGKRAMIIPWGEVIQSSQQKIIRNEDPQNPNNYVKEFWHHVEYKNNKGWVCEKQIEYKNGQIVKITEHLNELPTDKLDIK